VALPSSKFGFVLEDMVSQIHGFKDRELLREASQGGRGLQRSAWVQKGPSRGACVRRAGLDMWWIDFPAKISRSNFLRIARNGDSAPEGSSPFCHWVQTPVAGFHQGQPY